MLADIRDSFARNLRDQVYFSAEPAIPIYTEHLKTLTNDLNMSLAKVGVSVLVTTVIARQAQNQVPGKLYFEDIAVIAHAMENPKVNKTGISASDLAEAVAWLSKPFEPLRGFPLSLKDIVLGDHPTLLVYNVIFTMEGEVSSAPARPPAPVS